MPSRTLVFLITVIGCFTSFGLYTLFIERREQRQLEAAEDLQAYGSAAQKQSISQQNAKRASEQHAQQANQALLQKTRTELLTAIRRGERNHVSRLLEQHPVPHLSYDQAMRSQTGSSLDHTIWYGWDEAMQTAMMARQTEIVRDLQNKGVPCHPHSKQGKSWVERSIDTLRHEDLLWYIESDCFEISEQTVIYLNTLLVENQRYDWIWHHQQSVFQDYEAIPAKAIGHILLALLQKDDPNVALIALDKASIAMYVKQDKTYGLFHDAVRLARFDVVEKLIANMLLNETVVDTTSYAELNRAEVFTNALATAISQGDTSLIQLQPVKSALPGASDKAFGHLMSALAAQVKQEDIVLQALKAIPNALLAKERESAPQYLLLIEAVRHSVYSVVNALLEKGMHPNILFMDPTLLAEANVLIGPEAKKIVTTLEKHGAKADYFDAIKTLRGISLDAKCDIGRPQKMPKTVLDYAGAKGDAFENCLAAFNECQKQAFGADDCMASIPFCPTDFSSLYVKSRCAGMTWRESFMYVGMKLDGR